MEPEKMIISKSISRVLGFGFWVYSFYHRWQDALLPPFCDNCCRSSAIHFLPWSNYAATRRWSRETWMAILKPGPSNKNLSKDTLPTNYHCCFETSRALPWHFEKWIFWVAIRKKKKRRLEQKKLTRFEKKTEMLNGKRVASITSKSVSFQTACCSWWTSISSLIYTSYFLGALLTRQKGNSLGFTDRHPGIPNGS